MLSSIVGTSKASSGSMSPTICSVAVGSAGSFEATSMPSRKGPYRSDRQVTTSVARVLGRAALLSAITMER